MVNSTVRSESIPAKERKPVLSLWIEAMTGKRMLEAKKIFTDCGVHILTGQKMHQSDYGIG